jgi:hypothetical protein
MDIERQIREAFRQRTEGATFDTRSLARAATDAPPAASRRRAPWAVASIILVVGAAAGISRVVSDERGAGPTGSPSGPIPQINIGTWRPGDGSLTAGVTGTIQEDANGCVYADSSSGGRVNLAWPIGYTVVRTESGLAVENRDGDVVAVAGTPVNLMGAVIDPSDLTAVNCRADGVPKYFFDIEQDLPTV